MGMTLGGMLSETIGGDAGKFFTSQTTVFFMSTVLSRLGLAFNHHCFPCGSCGKQNVGVLSCESYICTPVHSTFDPC